MSLFDFNRVLSAYELPAMLARIATTLGSLGATVLVLGGFCVIFVFPYLVARVFPYQAYHWTEIAAMIGIACSVLALPVGIARRARPFAGVVMFVASWVIGAFLWVWSVLIVANIWGIVALYMVNLFLGIGAIVGAFLALLLSANWSLLLQFVVIAAIIIGVRLLGIAWAEATVDDEGTLASDPRSPSLLYSSEAAAQRNRPGEEIVWLNTSSGVWAKKGTRWYGNTRFGAYVALSDVDSAMQRISEDEQSFDGI